MNRHIILGNWKIPYRHFRSQLTIHFHFGSVYIDARKERFPPCVQIRLFWNPIKILHSIKHKRRDNFMALYITSVNIKIMTPCEMENGNNFQNAFEVEFAQKFFAPEGEKNKYMQRSMRGSLYSQRQNQSPNDSTRRYEKRTRQKLWRCALTRFCQRLIAHSVWISACERLPAADENKIRLAGFCSYPHRQSEPADIRDCTTHPHKSVCRMAFDLSELYN